MPHAGHKADARLVTGDEAAVPSTCMERPGTRETTARCQLSQLKHCCKATSPGRSKGCRRAQLPEVPPQPIGPGCSSADAQALVIPGRRSCRDETESRLELRTLSSSSRKSDAGLLGTACKFYRVGRIGTGSLVLSRPVYLRRLLRYRVPTAQRHLACMQGGEGLVGAATVAGGHGRAQAGETRHCCDCSRPG